jgi:hypothetical protein
MDCLASSASDSISARMVSLAVVQKGEGGVSA